MSTLLVTDLDGTLLGPDGSVPSASLRRLVDVIRGLDLVFCVATSRSVHNVRSLPLEPDWLVAHDGACVFRHSDGKLDCTAEVLLNPPRVEALLDLALELSAGADGELLAGVFYGAKLDFEIDAWESSDLAPSVHASFAKLVSDGRQLNWLLPREARRASLAGGARAVSIFGLSRSVARARQAIPSFAGVRLHEYPETRGESGMAWLDAQASGVEKGLAVASICKESRFDQVVALGNGTNDVGMLSAASLAIAPADACPEAQAVATLVLDQGSEGGAFTEAVADRLPELLTTSVV